MAVSSATTPSPDLAPRLHLQAPTHLLHVLEEFDHGVHSDAPSTALRALKEAFILMLGISCDMVCEACIHLGANPEMYRMEEGDSYRLQPSEDRLKEGLYFLGQHTDDPVARDLVQLFFDETGSPRQFYKLTQGGKVEGGLGGLQRLSDFCAEARRAPGRGEAFKQRNAYLPHLEGWLTCLNRVFEAAELVGERTDLDGNQRVHYRLHGVELRIGYRLPLNDCKACIPSRLLEPPAEWIQGASYVGIPQEVPEHTLHLADRFHKALQEQDPIESTRLLRDTLEFMLRYFAGVGYLLCRELDCLSDAIQKLARNTESVDNCELLLQTCVEALKLKQDDVAAKAFVSVFYRRDANLLLQPRSHTNILLLEGVLSSWFKQERGRQPEASRYLKEFKTYYPLFRDWVRSMGPYFSHTEHFADEPSPQGQLPLTVNCGDHLLELMGDDYNLRIRQCPVCFPNPIWTQQANPTPQTRIMPVLSAEELIRRANQKESSEPPPPEPEAPVEKAPEAPKTFPGEFPPIKIPPDCPKFLGRVLRRLDVHVRRGELPESRYALRDALDYLVRYWAGVGCACAREAGKLSAEEEKMASQSLSIQECEKLLLSILKTFGPGVNELSEEILQVYYDRDLFSEELRPLGAHTRILQTDASADTTMQLLADFCESQDDCDIYQARRDLKTQLPVLRDWLARSQSFFEQCQHHEEEADKDGRMELVVQWDKTYLELVAPDYAFYIRPGCDQVPDLPVPEYIEPAEPVESQVLKPKVITTEELALQDPFLIHKVQYVGMSNNSAGVPCKSGVISIQNAGGGTLTGRAYATHPCIEVSPNRFREKTQLTYWLDEKSIPRDYVPVLVLRSGGDERQITLAEMRPLSKFSTMPKDQALIIIYSPAVLGFFAINIILVKTAKKIDSEIGLYTGAKLKVLAPDFLARSQSEASLFSGLFLLYTTITPVVTMLLYRRFSHSMQDLLTKHFTRAISSPLAMAALTAIIGSLAFTCTRNPEITHINLGKLTPWALALGMGGFLYAQLEYEQKFAEWIQEPALRKALGPCLVMLFIILWTLALS